MGVHKVPTVHLELTIRAGTAADPPEKFGLASLTADMLDEGAGTRDALEIADAVDYLGAELSATGAVDASYVDLHVPVARLADALPIMADVVARPTFPDAELEAPPRGASRLAARDRGRSGAADPGRVSRGWSSARSIGTARRRIGTAASLKGFTVADLKAFHAAHYRPANAVLIVAGDVTADAVVPLLERAFGGMERRPARPRRPRRPATRRS